MRLFQCSFPAVNDYDWARENEKYQETYKKDILESDQKLLARDQFLTAMDLPHPSKRGASISGCILTERQISDSLLAGQVPEVQRAIAIEDSLEGELIKFRTVVEKLERLPTPERAFNQKVEVHMPGQALATYNEVCLLESGCSDELQGRLDDGWRIISACPQPDQRRPDYILGRFNADRGVRGSDADRGRHPKALRAPKPVDDQDFF